jgi:tetratricopeptide (TPR) repeat protein
LPVFLIVFGFYFVIPSYAQKQIKQSTIGDQSPAVVGRDVTITYGVSQEAVDDLLQNFNIQAEAIKSFLKTIEEKNVAIQDRDAKLQELAQKYKKLEERLASRSAEDEFAAQAKGKLDKGDLEGAEELLLKSLEKNLKFIAEKKKAAASDAFELGSLKELQLDYQSAKKYYEQAAQIEPENPEYLNDFGRILVELGEHKNAIKNFEKALAIDLKVYGDQHPKVAIRYNNLGAAWYSLGEYQKAIDYYEKALAIDLKVYGDQHPMVAIRYNNLGSAWHSLGEYQKAIDYFEKALAIDLKVYGDQHPDVAIDYNNLGSAWDSLGEYQKAIDYFEKALFIFTSVFGNNHPYTKTVKSKLESIKKNE